jgi:CheY-like chemotaxis protein
MQKKVKILLTEDKKINQEIIIGILEGSNIKIDIANNGKEAIDKYHQQNYALILMDIDMPIMNGYEATQLIRLRDKNIPIIALTAHNSLESILKIKQVGMNECINKPVKVEKLYETFFKYINVA